MSPRLPCRRPNLCQLLKRLSISGLASPHAPSADEAGLHACFLRYFDLRSSVSSLYDGAIVNEANRVLTEAPERLKESHRAFYRWTQAGESIAYGSSGELRISRCDLGVFFTSPKVSRHLDTVIGEICRAREAKLVLMQGLFGPTLGTWALCSSASARHPRTPQAPLRWRRPQCWWPTRRPVPPPVCAPP
jgi:hypothetical protein